jgi:hypothetical protein
MLVLGQIILSLQLPFAVVPLVLFTSDRRKMGEFASPAWVSVAWITADHHRAERETLADTFGLTEWVMKHVPPLVGKLIEWLKNLMN